MRISDWSSDVCSSDLIGVDGQTARGCDPGIGLQIEQLQRRGPIRGGTPDARRSPEPRTDVGIQRPCPDRGSLGLRHHFSDLRANSVVRSEEHTSELQSLMRTWYAVLCLQTKIISDM